MYARLQTHSYAVQIALKASIQVIFVCIMKTNVVMCIRAKMVLICKTANTLNATQNLNAQGHIV